MIIIGLTDLHGDITLLDQISEQLREADMVLVAGDLTHFGRMPAARRVIDALRRYTEDRLLAVPGNCDYFEVGRCLSEEKINLDQRHQVLGGIEWIGIGGSLPCPGQTPNEADEEEFERNLSLAASGLSHRNPLIFVSHQPPINTRCDTLQSGTHVGSTAVRKFIETHSPLLCLTGHIHEAAGIDRIGETHIINPGPLWMGGYAYAELDDDGQHIKTLDIRRIL
jgi:hypothetical protein